MTPNPESPTDNQTVNSHSAVEMEKLKLEVAELRWKVKWYYRIAQNISIVTAFIAVAAFVVSVFQYNSARDRELKKPVWEKQLAVAFEISNTAAAIATTLDPDNVERKKSVDRFWQLYYGPSIFVEDESLKQAMIDFGDCLNGQNKCGSEAEQSARLPELSLNLTNKCRSAMGLTWQLNLEDLYKNRVQTTPSPLP